MEEGKKHRVLIDNATEAFLRDAEARGLRKANLYKYQLLFRELGAYAQNKGVKYLTELDMETLRRFRESWVNKNYTAQKKLEALRTFFRFAHESGWIGSNPASLIKMPKTNSPPTMPFTQDEIQRIIKSCDIYPHEGHPNKFYGKRLKVLVLLLRHSGLRIADAVTLETWRVVGDVLILRTAKTGTEVRVPLPPAAIDALDDLCAFEYFFWSGASTKKSCVGNYQRAFKRLYELAGVKNGHAHRWRDTFSIELLQSDVPLEQVSILLGHQSIKVTQKPYAPFVKARQEQLETAVRNA